MNTEQHACEVTHTQNTQAPPPQITNIEAKQKKMLMDTLEYALSKLSYHFFHKGNKCWSKLKTMEPLPHRHFYTFLDNNFCYCHSLHITYFQLNWHARPKCGKGLLGQGPLLWEETTLYVSRCHFLWILQFPVPMVKWEAAEPAMGKKIEVGQVPRTLMGAMGGGSAPHCCSTAYPLGGVSVKYQYQNRLRDISEENTL